MENLMPTFRVTGGALTLDSVGSNYPSNELPGGGHIDNSLPPGVRADWCDAAGAAAAGVAADFVG